MDLFEFASAHPEKFEQQSPVAIVVQMPGTLPADDLPDDYHAIVTALQNARGRENAMFAHQIADAANIRPDASPATRGTAVRMILARFYPSLPWPLNGDSSSGYYIPVRPDEVAHYRRDLHSRASAILCRLRDYKRQCRIAGLL